jgi:hypothetical protein
MPNLMMNIADLRVVLNHESPEVRRPADEHPYLDTTIVHLDDVGEMLQANRNHLWVPYLPEVRTVNTIGPTPIRGQPVYQLCQVAAHFADPTEHRPWRFSEGGLLLADDVGWFMEQMIRRYGHTGSAKQLRNIMVSRPQRFEKRWSTSPLYDRGDRRQAGRRHSFPEGAAALSFSVPENIWISHEYKREGQVWDLSRDRQERSGSKAAIPICKHCGGGDKSVPADLQCTCH